MTIYDVGEPVILTNQFYSDPAQTTLADPATVVLTIRNPAGALLTPVVVHASLGTYTYLWTPALRGMHEIRWVGTGAVGSVEQYGIHVRGGFPAAADLVDVQTVRAFMKMPKTEDSNDPILEGLIATASAHLMESYGHEWAPAGAAPAARLVTYRGGGILNLAPYNAQAGTVTSVSLSPDGGSALALTAATDWEEMPAANRWGVTNYLRLRNSSYPTDAYYLPQTASVTATWGYPSIPQAVMQAACWTVKHWHTTQVGSRPSGFSTEDTGDAEPRVAIPQMARWLLRPFERLDYA